MNDKPILKQSIDFNEPETFSECFTQNGKVSVLAIDKIIEGRMNLRQFCSSLHKQFKGCMHFEVTFFFRKYFFFSFRHARVRTRATLCWSQQSYAMDVERYSIVVTGVRCARTMLSFQWVYMRMCLWKKVVSGDANRVRYHTAAKTDLWIQRDLLPYRLKSRLHTPSWWNDEKIHLFIHLKPASAESVIICFNTNTKIQTNYPII